MPVYIYEIKPSTSTILKQLPKATAKQISDISWCGQIERKKKISPSQNIRNKHILKYFEKPDSIL